MMFSVKLVKSTALHHFSSKWIWLILDDINYEMENIIGVILKSDYKIIIFFFMFANVTFVYS